MGMNDINSLAHTKWNCYYALVNQMSEMSCSAYPYQSRKICSRACPARHYRQRTIGTNWGFPQYHNGHSIRKKCEQRDRAKGCVCFWGGEIMKVGD